MKHLGSAAKAMTGFVLMAWIIGLLVLMVLVGVSGMLAPAVAQKLGEFSRPR